MICENCQKNVASVHMTQIINGTKMERHICENCAKENILLNPVSFQDFFQGMFSAPHGIDSSSTNSSQQKEIYRCEYCGLPFQEFQKTGFFGCSKCYCSFTPQVNSILKKIHGSNLHQGKIPQKSGGIIKLKRQIDILKKNLNIAIDQERYEDAANIRDQIKFLEGESKNA